MKLKFFVTDIFIILFFNIGFIYFPYFRSYDLFKYCIIAIIAVYLLPKYKILFRNQYKRVNLVLFLFLCVVLINSLINRNKLIERDVFLAAIVFSAMVFEAFLLFQYIEYKNRIERTINIIFYLTLFIIVITDVLLFLKPELYIESKGYYLIGNKFSVAYMHLQLIILFWSNRISQNSSLQLKDKIVIFVMLVLTICVCLYISSATGIVGCALLLLYIVLHNKIGNFIMKPLSPVIILIISSSFLFVFDTILNSSFMKFIIEDILGRDMTLTGRMSIYKNMHNLLKGHFWTGYGYGSTYEVCMNIMRAPNTQNGLLENLMQYGIFGVILVLFLIYLVFKQNKGSICLLPIVGLIYIYIILASIEITISLHFFVLLALLVTGYETQKNKEIDENIIGEQNVRIN